MNRQAACDALEEMLFSKYRQAIQNGANHDQAMIALRVLCEDWALGTEGVA